MIRNKAWLVIPFLIMLGAWWLRVRDLNQPDFWSDEAYSLYHLRSGTINGLLESLGRNEETPPLYFLILAAWATPGTTEFYIRVLSAMPGILAVAVVMRVGQTLGGTTTGCIAGGLMATSYLAVILSRQARAYGLGMALIAALMWLTLRLIVRNKRRDAGLWVLLSALCVSTSYLAGTVVFASWLSVVLLTDPSRQTLKRAVIMAVGVILTSLGLLPLLLTQLAWSSPTLTWIPPPSLRLILQALDEFTFGAELRAWPRLAVLMAIPVLTIAVILGGYWIVKTRKPYTALLFILLMPSALIYAISFRQPIFLPRYIFIVMPPLCVVLASAFNLIPARWQRIAVGLASASLFVSGLMPYPFIERIPWAAVAEQVKLRANLNEGIIFSPFYNRLPFEMKYDGPRLQILGVQDYAAYVPRAGQIAFAVSEADIEEHFVARNAFWLVEDVNWPVGELPWWVVSEKYVFPGALLVRYQRAGQ